MNSAILTRIDATAAARFFRVLGDPTRLKILELLTVEKRTAGELVTMVGQAQPRITTHLACLLHCGFVSTERRDKEDGYYLAFTGLEAVLVGTASALTP